MGSSVRRSWAPSGAGRSNDSARRASWSVSVTRSRISRRLPGRPVERYIQPRQQTKETSVYTVRQSLFYVACLAAYPAGTLLADQPKPGDKEPAAKIVYVEDLVYGR